ncbi:hypothetical protein BV898_01378 [Hypsibius exemplaris]|uniref:Uncharacterized protein n=1 Tax=Hypsibius exemplaris TaxID=2072580 RepID=A0A1W0XBM3_HYPEX|nr:hypothetical protein BV898_01378 [Hypsibius exemplaris]
MALLARAKHEFQSNMYVERVLHLAANFVKIPSTPASRQDFNLEHRKMLKERLQFKVIRARELRLQHRGQKLLELLERRTANQTGSPSRRF